MGGWEEGSLVVGDSSLDFDGGPIIHIPNDWRVCERKPRLFVPRTTATLEGMAIINTNAHIGPSYDVYL